MNYIIQINQNGIEQIRAHLAASHKLGGDHFTDSMLFAWASDVENNFSEAGQAEFEIRGMDSVTGSPILCRISEDGYDKIPFVEDGE